MGRGFIILRSLVFVFILAGVLAWVPVQIYKGDIITSLLLSLGMFVLSLVVALVLLFVVKRD